MAKKETRYPEQEIIRRARQARGWTRNQLAGRVYVTESAIYAYEIGYVRAPWEELYRVMPELLALRNCVKSEGGEIVKHETTK